MFEVPDVPPAEGLSSLERMLVLKKLPFDRRPPFGRPRRDRRRGARALLPQGQPAAGRGRAGARGPPARRGSGRVRRAAGSSSAPCPPASAWEPSASSSGDPFDVDAVAVEDTLTLEIEADLIFEVFEDRFSLMHHMLRDVSRQLIDQIVDLRLDPPASSRRSATRGRGRARSRGPHLLSCGACPSSRKASINTLFEVSRGMTEIRFPPARPFGRRASPRPAFFCCDERATPLP